MKKILHKYKSMSIILDGRNPWKQQISTQSQLSVYRRLPQMEFLSLGDIYHLENRHNNSHRLKINKRKVNKKFNQKSIIIHCKKKSKKKFSLSLFKIELLKICRLRNSNNRYFLG